MAETLDEFDEPSPCVKGYCSRISEAEFEQQAAETTEAELQNLLTFLESNPRNYYDIVRKKKVDQLNVLSFVKVKVMSTIKGEDYLQTYFTNEECQENMEILQEQIMSAFDYAQEAKGNDRRFSKRLAQKRKLRNEPNPSIKARDVPTTPGGIHVPPPPPPPPIATSEEATCKKMKNNCQQLDKSSTINSKSTSKGLSKKSSLSSFVVIQEEFFQSLRGVHGRGVVKGTERRTKHGEHPRPQDGRSNCDLERASNEDKRLVENKENAFIAVESQEKSGITKSLKKSISRKFSKPKLFSLNNFQDEIANGRLKLRCVNSECYDEMTPYQLRINMRKTTTTNPEDGYPMFNQVLVDKFRNARSPAASPATSPSSSPSGNFDYSDFNSP